jgi:hypothetical protein
MKTAITIILIVSIAGNFVGAYLLYKAIKLRDEVKQFQKYHRDLLAKYENAKTDFAGTGFYAEDNNRLRREKSAAERKKAIVLYGASITKSLDPAKYFPDMPVINRGIGSQIHSQLLARFPSDVLDLEPGKVVLKFCSGNFHPEYDMEMVWGHFEMMAVAAQKRGIMPILATVVPLTRAGEKYDGYSVTDRIRAFNERVIKFAAANKFPVVDYFSALADKNGFLPDTLARDEIHPNDKGCEIMAATLKPLL